MKIEIALDELESLAHAIALESNGFFKISLVGELGTGKTTFSKLLVRHLGIMEDVTSPTYSIENQYLLPESDLIVRHIDLYRGLSSSQELELLSKNTHFNNEILLVEWGNLISNSEIVIDLEVKFSFLPLQIDELEPSSFRILELKADIPLLKSIEKRFFLKKDY